MPRRKEIPFAPIPTHHGTAEGLVLQEPKGTRVHNVRCDTEWGALMECAPHQDPEWSRGRLLPLRDTIQDAMDGHLTERERFVFDSVTIERVSMRDLSKRMTLSKSHVHRVYHAACAKLREALTDDPTIKEYLTR